MKIKLEVGMLYAYNSRSDSTWGSGFIYIFLGNDCVGAPMGYIWVTHISFGIDDKKLGQVSSYNLYNLERFSERIT